MGDIVNPNKMEIDDGISPESNELDSVEGLSPNELERLSENCLSYASKVTDIEEYMTSDNGYQDGLIRVKGMINLGNTCYMNSALQALLSCNILNSRIIRYTQDHPDIVGDMSPMFLAYVQLIYQLMDEDPSSDEQASTQSQDAMRRLRQQNTIRPMDFKKILGQENSMFAGFSQQDAHELILFLLNDITEIPKYMQQRMTDKEKNASHELTEYRKKHKETENEFKGVRKIMRDTYFGTYRQVIECLKCHHITDTIFRHVDIVLPVPRDMMRHNAMARFRSRNVGNVGSRARNIRLQNGRIVPNPRAMSDVEAAKMNSMNVDIKPKMINIADCFKKYSETETFDNDNKIDCGQCKIKTKSIKRMELDYVPELTILTINRFEGLQKIDEPIRVYPKIELDGYPLRLIATVNHMGTVNGGHYTAYISRSWYEGGKLCESWFNANDSYIHSIKKQQVLADPRVYLAFYERMQ